jgi:hypothetical protein
MKKGYSPGAVDQTVDIFIQNSASTTGAGLTGLVFNSAGLTCYYRKQPTGTATVVSLVTQTVGGAHADGGFVEIDATNMPGLYRLDLPDAVFSTENTVSIMLKGATNMAPLPMELMVGNNDVRLASVVTHGGSIANIGTGAITSASFAAGAINAAAIATNAIDADALATDAVNEIADQVWDEALAGHLTAGSAGKALSDASSAGDPWATALPGSYGAGTAGARVGGLTFTVANQVDANIQSVNDVQVVGTGAVGNEWGPV